MTIRDPLIPWGFSDLPAEAKARERDFYEGRLRIELGLNRITDRAGRPVTTMSDGQTYRAIAPGNRKARRKAEAEARRRG